MIMGTGIDIVSVARIRKVMARFPERFRERVFTAKEMEYISTRKGDTIPLFAARYAAKEAVLKAIGCGIGPAALKEVEVVSRTGCPPRIKLHGNAGVIAKHRGIGEILVSLSHERDTACAQAMALSCAPVAHEGKLYCNNNGANQGTPEIME
ncbi:MAG: holo-ACP synthase [Firmicutes bacterium]|jgi:holo-[acyl-carrier protein] synthase|nr:holo-ACP synthase [Bacillota bacterium]